MRGSPTIPAADCSALEQFAFLALRAQDIDPLSVCLGLNAARLPDTRATVLYWWIWTKAGFVATAGLRMGLNAGIQQRDGQYQEL